MNIYEDENKILNIESMDQMPFDDILSLYRQGYRLDEYKFDGQIENVSGNVSENDIGYNIRGLATCKGATCPCSIVTGSILTLSTSVSSGTAPFTYHWSVTKPDGTIDTSLTGASNQYTFATTGNYTVSVNVTDSCTSGAKTSNTDSCVITASTGGGGGAGCDPLKCLPDKNFCISGNCIPKTYVLLVGVGIVALLILKS